MFAPAGGPDAGAAASALSEALAWFDAELAAGGGPYAMGANFTLADAAIAPFMLRLGVLARLCDYEVPTGLKALESYRSALRAHPAVAASMVPPEGAGSYEDAMLDTYRAYVAARKAAA